ncbi:MAG: glycosyltransferase family 4 protein [Candidatus Omnitrophota bacterium]
MHHGIDEEIYRPDVPWQGLLRRYPELKNKKVVFHPARMGLAKGCDVSIKALRIIRQAVPDVLLVLAGTKNIIDWGATQEKDIAYIVSLVDFFRLRDNVLIDVFSLQDMPRLYTASRVCLYPSTVSEPFGLTMLEALSSARPMIVTESGGMPEIIQNDVNGFVIPIKNFEVLAERVIEVLTNTGLCQRLGDTGRRMVEDRYTKQMMADNTLEIYSKIKSR